MTTPTKPDAGVRIAEIDAKIAELEAANEAATSWGAAVGARYEHIKELRSERALLAQHPMTETPSPDFAELRAMLDGGYASEPAFANLREAATVPRPQRLIAQDDALAAIAAYDTLRGHARTLLSALDAQKARADKAEAELAVYRNAFGSMAPNPACGFSSDGINLIGDEQSIKRAKSLFHRAGQIATWQREFDEHKAAAEARITALEGQRDRLVEGLTPFALTYTVRPVDERTATISCEFEHFRRAAALVAEITKEGQG